MRAMRVYPSNTAYCFACSKYFTPTLLISARDGCKQWRAAKTLLHHYNIPTNIHWRERYNDLVVSKAQEVENVGQPADWIEALRTALAREVEDFERLQFTDDFSAAMAEELDKLTEALRSPVVENARQWYSRAVKHLLAVAQEGGERQ